MSVPISIGDLPGSEGGAYGESHSGKIRLECGIDPPAILLDIVNLPDPIKLGITIRYFNYDDVALYFKITAENLAWTFGTVELGALGSGASTYRNLDEFGSRPRPSTELEENIRLILRAYTDPAYTNLKWTYEKTLTVKFINSTDPSYTVDVLNNFDDGTVQGWSAVGEVNQQSGYPRIGVATNYVLSPPYSLRMIQRRSTGGDVEMRARIEKTFTTPNRDIVYAIIDMRHFGSEAYLAQTWTNFCQIKRDTTTLMFLGRPWAQTGHFHSFPPNRWLRAIVPLPKNTTLTLSISQSMRPYNRPIGYLWIDDFKVISK